MIRLTTTKAEILKALKTTQLCVANSGSDISTHYLFRQVQGKVQVVSYFQRLFASSFLDCDIDDTKTTSSAAFTVEAKRLHKLLEAEGSDSTLIIQSESGVTNITTPTGSNRYQSLDPANFPMFDGLYKESVVTAEVDPTTFAAALNFSKLFVSSQDTKEPQFCVVEARNGCLQASDQRTASLVTLDSLKDAAFRVYSKDIPNLISFVEGTESGKIVVRQHAKVSIFEREDGSLFGENVFRHALPTVDMRRDDAPSHTWKISKNQLKSRIKFLASGANWDDTRLVLKPHDGDQIFLQMQAASGEEVSCEVSCQKSSTERAIPVPKKGFAINYTHLLKILELEHGDTLSLGVAVQQRGGWLRIEKTENNSFYLAILGWLL